MSRTLRLAGLLLSTAARAQITGSDCSYADGTLCVPTYCAAPKLVTTHQELDASLLSFSAPNASRVTETVEFTPNFNGYQLHRTCPDSVTDVDPFAGGGAECGSGSFANCTAKKKPYKWPKGCAAISPLPTYVAGTEDCVESDFPAPHNKSFCDPGNGVLIGSVGSLMAVWVVCILLLFYAMALVCEEFLVPAINIVCERTGIPDDVAGATLLAAGCNSPEFFSSIIGIFIADSTVGVGTVVGSAPFNVCCITAGAAIAVGGQLYLDPWLMGRELLALFFALWMFLFVMDDYLVHWWEAGLMVAYYAFVYVPTLAFFDQIKKGILFVVTCAARNSLGAIRRNSLRSISSLRPRPLPPPQVRRAARAPRRARRRPARPDRREDRRLGLAQSAGGGGERRRLGRRVGQVGRPPAVGRRVRLGLDGAARHDCQIVAQVARALAARSLRRAAARARAQADRGRGGPGDAGRSPQARRVVAGRRHRAV